jgi:hypothetical protein
MITSAEPPETFTALCCPGCGLQPTGKPLTCPDCYCPVWDCCELERLYGFTPKEWNEHVAEYLSGVASVHLRSHVASMDSLIDAGSTDRKHRSLGRLLRDELTRRHHACEDTIPPPPSVPREERETCRPGVR